MSKFPDVNSIEKDLFEKASERGLKAIEPNPSIFERATKIVTKIGLNLLGACERKASGKNPFSKPRDPQA